ncbi:hypothetical protein [Neobacillus mesonae]|uniref:DUF2577 domain-containing protein n=1 Tax=Neobacillus mesonae TaxID=1193713 RepID=A0A3Q9QSB6_9BACI|nr:hypothetical protein [Neobacillus mesonae]AZU61081.1 hypothetical protein CHR53_07335 [Neobacillus mesonae]
MSRLEGNGASRFIQLMQQHGHNKDIDIIVGTITAAPPDIKLRLPGDNFDLDKDDVIVADKVAQELAEGDAVIVLIANNEQQYYIIDKAVTY